MLDSTLSILTLFSMLLAGYGVGRPVVRAVMKREEQELSSVLIWSLVVGWVTIGLGITVLGMMGLLYRVMIGIATLIAAFFGVSGLARAIAERSDVDQGAPSVLRQMLRFPENDDPLNQRPNPPRWMLIGLGILAAIAITASFFGALAPPTAGDALCYHLELPKRFLASGGLVYLPYHDNSTYPLLVEIWYLWAMILHNTTAAFHGAVAAQLVHWMCGVMLGMAAFTLARPILGPRWSMIVASVVCLTPGVTNQMTAPLNDVALAMLTTMALAAWWRFAVNREGLGWCILAGVAAGGALGTKYIAGLFALAVAVSTIGALIHQKNRRAELFKGALLVGGVAMLLGGVWYARAYHYRGNPVYPFLAELHQANSDKKPSVHPPGRQKNGEMAKDATPFETLPEQNAPNDVRRLNEKTATASFETLPQRKAPLGRSPWALLSAPWHVSVHPDRFGGRSHQLGILFLAGLPGLLFTRRLRGLGTLLTTAGVYFVLWFLLRQNVRFLFPIIPLLAVGVVWVWVEMYRMTEPARFLGMAFFVMVLVAYAGVSVRRSYDRVPVAIGLESHQEYLLRCEPSYGIAQKLNQRLAPDARLLSQDFRHFYLNCPVTSESVFRRFISYESTATLPGELVRRLREAGFSHLLLIRKLDDRGDPIDSSLQHYLEVEPGFSLEILATVNEADGKRQYLLGNLGG